MTSVVFWFIVLYLEGSRVFHGENFSLLALNVCVRGKQQSTMCSLAPVIMTVGSVCCK